MANLRQEIELAARSNVPVLITGRTGTGKELASRAIHAASGLAHRPFVAHNCAASPRELFDSELFGHVRGAFTGAVSDSRGLLRESDGGMLFLDELDSMDPGAQAKLLRVLDDGEARPVGSTKTYRVSVRFLAATNRNPDDLIRDGLLREDLYYRLRGVQIHVPDLAQRIEDLPALAAHFLGKDHPGCSDAALRALRDHAWPGNVRELQNLLHAAKVRAPERKIELGDLTHLKTTDGTARARSGTLRDAQLELIERTLDTCGGNLSRAAKALGVDRSTLRRKLRGRRPGMA